MKVDGAPLTVVQTPTPVPEPDGDGIQFRLAAGVTVLDGRG
jgi:hypothetical protein